MKELNLLKSNMNEYLEVCKFLNISASAGLFCFLFFLEPYVFVWVNVSHFCSGLH